MVTPALSGHLTPERRARHASLAMNPYPKRPTDKQAICWWQIEESYLFDPKLERKRAELLNNRTGLFHLIRFLQTPQAFDPVFKDVERLLRLSRTWHPHPFSKP